MIVLSTWHSLQSSGTGVSTEAFLDCIHWCEHSPWMWAVPLYGVGLGLFQKERKRWARVVFREYWEGCGGHLGPGSMWEGWSPFKRPCRKLWRETAFQLKWELQRIGDPRLCDTDKNSYRWKVELGNEWIREKLCMPVSEMDGRGSQDLWRYLTVLQA